MFLSVPARFLLEHRVCFWVHADEVVGMMMTMHQLVAQQQKAAIEKLLADATERIAYAM